MTLSRYPVDHYPLTYRQQAYRPLLEAIKGHKSVFVTSVSGMGKTHLLRFVAYRRDLHRQAFGQDAARMAFIAVDFHGVGDLAALYATWLAETHRHLDLREKEVPTSPLPAVVVGQMISTLVQDAPGLATFVFIFDGLEMLYPNESELAAFFKQLRVVRDNLGGAASFILGAKPPLPDIEALGGNFAYLLDDPPVVWLPLLTGQEARVMAEVLSHQVDLAVDAARLQTLLAYVGGHPRLLKECLVQLSRGRLSIEDAPEIWQQQLQDSTIIQRLCRQICEDISSQEEVLLQAVSLGGTPTQAVEETVLHQTGLVSKTASGGWRITSPLFAAYVRAHQPPPARVARSWLNEVTLLPHEFRYRNLSAIRLRPKEYDVLQLLVGTEGEVVSRAALIDAAWPTDIESGVQEDSNLNTVVSGLRKKLKDAKYPFQIKGIRKRGYQFRFQA